jgi:crossover junction endodeoxyribonuclease RuvC
MGESVFIGVDPSATSTGLALVSGIKCEVCLVKPPKGCLGPARLAYHRDCLKEFIGSRTIAGACIESASHGSTSQGDKLGQVRGVYELGLKDLGCIALEVPPTSVKLFATGSGGATKDRMLETARERWPAIDFKTDDLADAAWLAEFAKALTETPENFRRCQLEAIKGILGRSNGLKKYASIGSKHILNV